MSQGFTMRCQERLRRYLRVARSLRGTSGCLRRVSGVLQYCRRDLKEYQAFQEVSGLFLGVPGGFKGYRKVSGAFEVVLWGFKGLQGVSEAFQGISRALQGGSGTFLEVPDSFRRASGGLRGASVGFRDFQGGLCELQGTGVLQVYRGLQGY